MLEDSISKLGLLALSRVARQGLSVRATEDIELFEASLRDIGKKENYPMLSPRWQEIPKGHAFGLILSDPDGNVIGGVAARYVDLGKGTLADHIKSTYKRIYGGGVRDAVEVRAEIAYEVRGTVVYLGELYLDKNWQRGRVNTSALLFYMQYLCVMKWRPDYLYGFIRNKGIHRSPWYGFSNQTHGSVQWLVDVSDRGEEECLVISRPADLASAGDHFFTHKDEFPKSESSS
jgi:hypothetical protein